MGGLNGMAGGAGGVRCVRLRGELAQLIVVGVAKLTLQRFPYLVNWLYVSKFDPG